MKRITAVLFVKAFLVTVAIGGFVGLAKAENISGAVHDGTLPDHTPGTGRG